MRCSPASLTIEMTLCYLPLGAATTGYEETSNRVNTENEATFYDYWTLLSVNMVHAEEDYSAFQVAD